MPFSLAFARHHDRDVVIHRTAWNRLDVSDPASGHLLTARGPTCYRSGEPTPDHYLDYFHGALHVSPDGARIFDDGWFWHPIGIPEAWELAAWLDDNAWESEDGPTKIEFCFLEYWDRAVTWIGNHRVAIEDTGDDDTPACTRVFDVTKATPRGPGRVRQAAEVAVLYGPEGRVLQRRHNPDERRRRWPVPMGSGHRHPHRIDCRIHPRLLSSGRPGTARSQRQRSATRPAQLRPAASGNTRSSV